MPDAAVTAVRIADALSDATARLTDAGCDTPRLDAELLLASVLEVSREQLLLDRRQELDAGDLARYGSLIERRVGHEPVAYILGHKGFRHITLHVDRRVLIPRPESELLVEVGLGLAPGSRVIDVGTGSGAIALALKHERPDLDVVGTDVSAEALEVARSNATRLRLAVPFIQGDLLAGLSCDAVLANLPYVVASAELGPEIAGYEPRHALDGGEDGLRLIRRLVSTSNGVCMLALEVGFDQSDRVAELLVGAGFQSVERLRDLAGHERVLVGR